MYIFYITYVIVCNCCSVALLIAKCVHVLKGVSLTILYLDIGEIKNLSVCHKESPPLPYTCSDLQKLVVA